MRDFWFNLGETVKDINTSYSGKITARCEYITDRRSYLVENIDNTGRPIEWWIEEERLIKA
jgi:hypothetical protein